MELDALAVEEFIRETCNGSADTVDLRDCSFAEVSGMVRLVLLAHHLSSQGRFIRVLIPEDTDVQSYLERTNTFRQLEGLCTFDEPIEHLQQHDRVPTDRLVGLRPLEEQGQIRAILEGFSSGLKAHRNIASDIIDAIDKVLFETLQNIPDHAVPDGAVGAHHGMAALQRYSWRLCLSVGDLGMGIRESLTGNPKFPPDRYDHARAIEAAITGSSRHADIGRGGGLMSVVAAIQKVGGWLRVRSGDAGIVITAEDNRRIEQCAFFPGTQIDISVPLRGRN